LQAAKLTARCIACSKHQDLVNKVPAVLKDAVMAALCISVTLLTSSMYLLQAMHLAASLAAATAATV